MVETEVRSDGIAILTLSNPPLNLNTLTTLDQLVETCGRLAADDKVRVVIITGAGDRAFCAGSDIKEFADVRDQVVDKKLSKENTAFTAIEQLPMPVIAALNGTTLGGGAEIALACDLRIIDEKAKIGFPEVKLGVFPGSGGVFRLPRLVGPSVAMELLYTGDLVDASYALGVGLVNRIAPAGNTLEAALALASAIAKGPALALSLIKAGVRDSLLQDTRAATDRTLADSHAVFTGPDIEEGIDAFFAKRKPEFTAPRRPRQ
nr:enoyl-CoA hydratase-related protein [Devosia marina]